MSNNVDCLIEPNPDIAGIGVRTSLYVQAVCVLVISFSTIAQLEADLPDVEEEDERDDIALCLSDRHSGVSSHHSRDAALRERERWLEEKLENQHDRQREERSQKWRDTLLKTAGGMLVYGCALIISAIVQATTSVMSAYHGFIIIFSTWITAYCAFPAQLCLLLEHVEEGSIRISKETLYLFIGHSIHLSLTGGYSIWFFHHVSYYRHKQDATCAMLTLADILGHPVPLGSPVFHTLGTVLSYMMIIPVVNVLFVGCVMDIAAVVTVPVWVAILKITGHYGETPQKPNDKVDGVFLGLIAITVPFVLVVLIAECLEGTISVNSVAPGEGQWTLGQTLALFMVVLPLSDALQSLRDLWKAKIHKVNAHMTSTLVPVFSLGLAIYRFRDQIKHNLYHWDRMISGRLPRHSREKRANSRSSTSALNTVAW